VGLLIKFALWRIRSAPQNRSIYSDNYQKKDYVASTFDTSAIGKTGVVLSDLKPGGYILIDGKQHQAISQTSYVTKGSTVLVLYGEGESLIVKPIQKEQST
jgi:membrane-bound ClpP family serine protease